MDMFSSDSNFYEIGTSDDLKALWDADLEADPLLGSFRSSLYEAVDEWSLADAADTKSQVVIHDRLMSDAALATAPIKTEHSYSYPMPDSPCSLVGKMDSDDDDEDESMEGERFQGTSRSPPQKSRSIADMLVIKEEPASDTDSMDSFSMSPDSPSSSTTITSSPKTCRQQEQQSILKKSAVFLDTSSAVITHSRPLILPKLEIKVEPAATGFSLPPTPPSSTSSDNEGGVSQDVMDTRLRHYRRQSTTRVYLSTSSRQPIQSPLISTQMKGVTGTLLLTDEEKRTLVAEGYPVPTRLPLSKAEEKALKKIRRKIKNKISAQESRRKKKEYMDCLEKKVEVLTNENFDFKKKIELLEDSNATMLRELKKLQAIVTKDLLSSSSSRTIVPQYIPSKKDLSGRPSRS